MKVLLGVIDNKRPEYLTRTIESLENNFNYIFCKKVIVDDSGDKNYSEFLRETYGDRYDIVSHEVNRGLSGSIISLWSIAKHLDCDYIFHLEGDFLFNEPVNINLLASLLKTDDHLAQVALKRGPVNEEEIIAGGFMELKWDSYVNDYKDHQNVFITTHQNYFTLNPSLYPKWVVDLGWEPGWGEAEFSERLFSNYLNRCAFLDAKESPPKVTHIGHLRSDNWIL